MWCSELRPYLYAGVSQKVLVSVLTAPFSIQLPATTPMKAAEGDPSPWALTTHMEDEHSNVIQNHIK